MEVSIRDLKSRLSHWIARARAGEVLVVTSRDEPVAVLRGLATGAPDGIERLIAEGRATWSGGKPIGAAVQLSGAGKSVSGLVIEDRG
ncbi:MAG: type II toxin-antitoxin system prevent-host-death family antitoxin [Deltaproteobacteria bacterium]|nr:type II toxin-antitoxin system prevent-host-death family antitoxin [Deltaproteobacteria bacterium]